MRAWVVLVVLVGVAQAKPQLEMATDLTAAGTKATPVIRHGGGTSYVTLGAVVEPTSVRVVSMANDNSMFQMDVRMAVPVPKDRWPVVGEGGTWWRAESHGATGNGTEGDASFTLDRGAAVTLAKAYGVPLLERAKLDQGLRYRWSIAKTATRKKGDKIAVTLKVTNQGKTPIGFLVGGEFSARGDERFVPEIKLGGAVVPLVESYGGNGGMQYQKIAPGKSIEVTTDLRTYPVGAFSTAGRYAVTLRYEGEVAAPDDQTRVWDVAPETTATIVVK